MPGGTASYPSSVLMNAVPAKVAGRRAPRHGRAGAGRRDRIRSCWRPRSLAGVDEIYRVGGAQAVAALAYGTQTIAPVAKIVGPGNAYVAAAKRRVFGAVGIDMIAGPSEVLVLADRSGNPDWIAADLLAQAEHDSAAQAILITDEPRSPTRSRREVERQLADAAAARDRRARAGAISARSSWCAQLGDAIPLVDRLAPEHLEIMARDAEALSLAHPQCRRDFPRRRIRRKRSAIMSAAPTTFCRRRARRDFLRVLACSTS